jgi:predicted ATPase/class 3 adenylate cyclase/Tfp pilus assembly protein PilF
MVERKGRQLAAVMFCDMVGFTAAMQDDEQSALESRDRYRTVIEGMHTEFGGRIVQYYGDGTLSIFGNSVDAVRCAVAIQTELSQAPEVPVRVGLHVGDVVVEEHGLLGDAVNVASRIESFGQPGVVLVSDSVRDLVKNQPNLELVSLGEFHLENVARSFELFAVDTDGLVVPEPASLNGKGQRVIDIADLSNLPVQVTSFVGRVQESSELEELIGDSRLVTVTGAGGCGKTRLSMQVATGLLGEFADGVWLVELAAVDNAKLVVSQTAEPFGVRDMKTGRPLVDVLADYLAGKELLLLLDNCEHVIESCAALAESLLSRCPRLRIVATSRELLGVPGEVAFPVPPLRTRSPEETDIEEADAVRLFADRAAQVEPGFRLRSQTTPAVREIVRRLEGLPLAIELAASRANLLAPDQMLEHLEDRFRLITSGRRDRGRHTTLEKALDWSYDLLSDEERSLFRQLAVFAGGCSLEAVVGVVDVEGADPLDLLSRLVDQSLVEAADSAGAKRYRLLEPVRHYALGKLLTTLEVQSVFLRHAEYFVGLAEKSDKELRGPQQNAWARRIESDHDNLRSALDWSLSQRQDEMSLRLAAGMAWFWWVRGYWKEAQEWFVRVYEETGEADPVLRSRLVYKLAALAVQQARPADVTPLLEAALPVLMEHGTPLDVGWVMVHLSDVATDPERGKWLAAESLSRFSAAGDAWAQAYASMSLGYHLWFGDQPDGLTYIQEAVNDLTVLGDLWTAAWFAFNLGYRMAFSGDYAQGRQVIERSLESVEGTDDRWIIPHCKSRLAIIATMTGDHDEAKRLFDEALPVHQRIGDENCTALIHTYLGGMLSDEGHFASARQHLTAAVQGARELHNPYLAGAGLRRFGWLAAAEEDYQRAVRLLGATEALCNRLGSGVISEHDRRRTTELTAAVKVAIGIGDFDDWWNSGVEMDMDATVDYALNPLEDA